MLLLSVGKQYYLWNGEKLYQIPDTIYQQQVLEVKLALDDTVYVYLGKKQSFGILPKLDTERVMKICFEETINSLD